MSSLDIVKTAKEMNIETIITDNLDGGIAKEYADSIIHVSTTDYDELENYIKNNNIDGVFTGPSEFNINNMINICDKTGLYSYCTKKQWAICSNKASFKKLCNKYGVTTVPEYTFTDSNNESLDNVEYPVIVKPVDSYSGHGISICRDKSELEIGLEKGLSCSKSKTVVVEKYMTCKNVELYYIVQNGKAKLMTMSDRITRNDQNGSPVPIAFFHPSKYINEYLEKMNDKVCHMFEDFGLKQGVLFMEAFYDENNFYFYEMGYRLNATMEYKFVNHCLGYNPLKYMIQFATEGQFGNENIEQFNDFSKIKECVCELSPLLKKGEIKEIIGIDSLLNDEQVIYVHQMHHIGDCIDSTGTLDQNFARIHIVAENKEKLTEKIKWVLNTLHIYDQDGEEMIISYDEKEIENLWEN